MISMLACLDASKVSILSQRLYSLVSYWPNLSLVFKKKWPSGKEVFEQDFWLSLSALLSVGASFSAKLSQMLFEVIPNLDPPKNLSKIQGKAFLILLNFLLEIDDRPQISRLIGSICTVQASSQRMSSSSVHEDQDIETADWTVHWNLLNQIMDRTVLEQSAREDIKLKFSEAFTSNTKHSTAAGSLSFIQTNSSMNSNFKSKP